MARIWKTSKRELDYSAGTLVMGILNVTPDSFSDGGKFASVDDALKRVGQMIAEGMDILDIGGESTRPGQAGSARISADEEIARVVPVIEALAKNFAVPISIDTSKAEVAEAAIDAGAEIINDISGLRFDARVAEVAAQKKTGLVLMHLRGTFETMHKQEPVSDIIQEVKNGLKWSIEKALEYGVDKGRIALDIGLGFSKTFEQNFELMARLDRISGEFPDYPLLFGASHKSFIGKALGGLPVTERLSGSLAAAALAVWNGAAIIRTHDVKETAHAIRVVEAVKGQK
ncbi:MAG TPA: dihydropteroate synthase [Pyrinomonadaceae bacterium]|jgi:dihydropteroate synthase|nr:dihydropteroate synthase [Pyrinomonadaceae bacterium]